MWRCFSLVIHSDFAYHQNFRVLWVSCFFCFYTKALVQDISTTIEGTNQAAGNFSLPTPWSARVHSRHFPNQAFCLHSALLECCDVYTPPLHASYMNVFTPHLFTQVTWTLLHPTPPHPTPPLPPPWLMHDKHKRTYTNVAWRMRDKYKITYTSVAWCRRHNYKRTYTSVTWHMPEKYITWL